MRAPSRARGVTLVEILMATVIMTIVIIPVATLIFGGSSASEESRNYNTGINVAADIMANLLSPELPFKAIAPEGGPDTPLAWGGTRKQAAFTSDFSSFEKLLSDGGDPGDRIIVKHNVQFETFFFAGRYADTHTNTAREDGDIVNELTFAYFSRPKPDLSSDERAEVFLPIGRSPYKCTGEAQDDPAKNRPRDVRCKPAWPWIDDLGKVPTPEDLKKLCTFGPDYTMPLIVMDQDFFGEGDRGALMKILVGVRWNPLGNVSKGPGYRKNSREFWLVSFKAKLEDEE